MSSAQSPEKLGAGMTEVPKCDPFSTVPGAQFFSSCGAVKLKIKLSALGTPNIQWWREHKLTPEDILVQKKGSGGKKEPLVEAGLKSSWPNSSQSSFIWL